jgi:hypothetical protein
VTGHLDGDVPVRDRFGLDDEDETPRGFQRHAFAGRAVHDHRDAIVGPVVVPDRGADRSTVRIVRRHAEDADPDVGQKSLTLGNGQAVGTMSLLAYHHDRFRELNREIYATFYRELGVLIRQVSPGIPDAEVAARARLITSVLDGVALQIHAGVIGKRELTSRAAGLVVIIAQG